MCLLPFTDSAHKMRIVMLQRRVRLLMVTGLLGPILAQSVPPDLALFQAVQQASVADVKRLLDLGANVNAVNDAGATPLMWAIPDLARCGCS